MITGIRVVGYKHFGTTCYRDRHDRRQQHSRLHCVVTQKVAVKIFPFVKTPPQMKMKYCRRDGSVV
jgi:hypothetical protein